MSEEDGFQRHSLLQSQLLHHVLKGVHQQLFSSQRLKVMVGGEVVRHLDSIAFVR